MNNIEISESIKKANKIGTIVYIATPIIFTIVINLLNAEATPTAADELLTKILPLVILGQILMQNIFMNFQINIYKSNKNQKQTPDKFYVSLQIIKFAIVDAVYIYGIVVFLITGSREFFYYILPVALVMSYFNLPSEKAYKKFMEKLNKV